MRLAKVVHKCELNVLEVSQVSIYWSSKVTQYQLNKSNKCVFFFCFEVPCDIIWICMPLNIFSISCETSNIYFYINNCIAIYIFIYLFKFFFKLRFVRTPIYLYIYLGKYIYNNILIQYNANFIYYSFSYVSFVYFSVSLIFHFFFTVFCFCFCLMYIYYIITSIDFKEYLS